MRPTEILSAEHRVIEQVLDCLEHIAKEAEARGKLDADDAPAALEFLRTFADRCHHGKEEDQLFPKLTERGVPRHVGPLAVMLSEHVSGRARIAAMAASLPEAVQGQTRALARFVDEARGYVGLLRDHIAKEDNVLFPMAEACLSAEDRAAVLEAFERVETHDLGAHTHADMLALADRLAERHGVAKAATRSPRAFTGCGHHPVGGGPCGHGKVEAR